MKNKKGFTIIEILAVIVIIAVITSIAVPAIFKITKNSEKNIYCSKLEIVQKSAERYADDNTLSSTCEIDGEEYYCETITIQNLLNDSYIDPDGINGTFIDPRDKIAINTMDILVYSKNDRSYAYVNEPDCPSFVTSALAPNELTNAKHILTTSLNGGIWNGTSPVTLREGATLFLNDPIKTHYTFTGWQKSNQNSPDVVDKTFTMGTADITLAAQWLINSYTLTVNANGGTWSGTTPQTIDYNATATIVNPTRTNYTFAGWTVSGTGSSIDGTTFTMGSANTTLTANWTINNYTLTVLTDGGTWSGTTPQTIDYNATATIANPTKSGYAFTGWTVAGAGSTLVGTTFTMGTANATITANWLLTGYTLTVNANGGTWSGTSPQTLSSGATSTINNPTRTGYVFSNWTVSGAGSTIVGTTFTMGSATSTLTANWLAYASMYTYTGSSTVIDDGAGNWRIKFLTSGTFTPLANMTIDLFLVGGGGGGGAGTAAGSGGGGGRTATVSSVAINASQAYTVTIGAGGGGNAAGGWTYFNAYSINGGNPGTGAASYSWQTTIGGAGGSGGGGNGAYTGSVYRNAGNGGTNGSNGSPGSDPASAGGAGQGTSTEEFGVSGATRYGAGGGGGVHTYTKLAGIGGATGGGNGYGTIGAGSAVATSGTANTGGGGGGSSKGGAGGAGSGGSGIVVIRNHR